MIYLLFDFVLLRLPAHCGQMWSYLCGIAVAPLGPEVPVKFKDLI